jgi:hypothetical protein
MLYIYTALRLQACCLKPYRHTASRPFNSLVMDDFGLHDLNLWTNLRVSVQLQNLLPSKAISYTSKARKAVRV